MTTTELATILAGKTLLVLSTIPHFDHQLGEAINVIVKCCPSFHIEGLQFHHCDQWILVILVQILCLESLKVESTVP